MLQRIFTLHCFFLCLLLAVCPSAWGQATATLHGTVVDPSGALVPGAQITIERLGTGVPLHTVTTDERGYYRFPQLAPATYRIRLDRQGFTTVKVDNIELPVNTTRTLRLSLAEPSPLFQTIDVNTVDATIGTTISHNQIEALPAEGRTIAVLLGLQAGVVHTAIDDRQTPDTRAGSTAGARSDQTNITLDGVDVNDQQNGAPFKTALPLTMESIQEFRVVTASPTANVGRSSGPQVWMITRSGTNEFHGSLYEFNRNTATSANSFFNNSTVDPLTGDTLKRPKLIRNVFGGSLGGPIQRRRLFFFFNFEKTITRREEPVLRIVPSDTLRQGILRYRDSANVVQTVTPQQLQAMDPLGIGRNPSILELLQQYPQGNDPSQGSDGGLNFVGYRFNAPMNEDKPLSIGRLDYLTPDSRHNIFARGVLADFKEVDFPQQFPGQPAARTLLTNSKGIAVGHTWSISPRLTNDIRWGLTREGLDFTAGSTNAGLELRGFDTINDFINRNESRKLPTHNITEDLAWAKGQHALQFGVNFRNIHNKQFTARRTYPFYRSNNAWMRNQGRDVLPPGIAASFRAPYVRAQMALLGTISQVDATYFVNPDTVSVFTIPHIPRREFINNEFEWYVQDQWRLTRQITVTAGLRYSYFAPPYEKNGYQVRANFDVHEWFAERRDRAAVGIPSNANPLLSFVLAGKANNAPTFFDPDRNNFAPRVAVAWMPSFSDGLMHKIFGEQGQSAVRFGVSVVHDRTGGFLPVSTELTGAVGLSTFVQNPSGQFNYDTAPRFSGFSNLSSIPVPPAPPVGFPVTPDFVSKGFMVDSKLRTPYATTFNLSVSRSLPGVITLEAAYVGRIGKRLLVLNDFAAPAVNFRDPVSGQTWVQATSIISDLIKRDVESSAVTPVPFLENVFAPLAGNGQTATQAFYTLMYAQAPDWTAALHDMDVAPGGSTIYGPYTFFQQQFEWLPGWTNLGQSSYHAFQLIARKRFGNGLQADFNYTLAKALDNGSSVESEGQGAGQILNAFDHRQSLGPSNFDIRHQINSNFVLDVPVGRNARFGNNLSPGLNTILGNWRLTGIVRWHSGFPFPTSSGNGGAFPTNFFVNGPPTLKPGYPLPEVGVNKSAPGGPNIFVNPAAAYAAFEHTNSGFSGSRNVLHGPHYFALDMGIHKDFKVDERQTIQFRWEVFNATNTVNFDGRVNPLGTRGIDFDLDAPASFGKLRSVAGAPRVMQFGLRYQF